MASVYKRKTGKKPWQAQIRRKGFPLQIVSFKTESDAKKWARDIESRMDKGVFVSQFEAEKTTLKEALARYLKEETPKKKGAKQETNRINALMKERLAEFSLTNLRGAEIAKWRDELVEAGKAPTTIRNKATIISQVFETARVEWNMEGLHNPVLGVRMPAHRPGRERRLCEGEEERLLDACRTVSSSWVAPVAEFALATAMRQGEILALRWENISGNVARLMDTKNGTQRDVPLSSKARKVLEEIPHAIKGDVFPITQDALEYHFRKAIKDAELEDLRFHDLRHEATSRLVERGIDIIKISKITGHKTMSMLQRYTHFEMEKVAEELG